MNVTVALLLTFAAAAEPAEKTWMNDYGAALQVAREEGRPLLVVIEDAERGVRADAVKLSEAAADDALLAPYVLCRVDVGTSYGQQVAAAFKASDTPHVVITDRGARRQIFQRSGRMSSTEWRATLTAYRSGRRPTPEQVWQPEICTT